MSAASVLSVTAWHAASSWGQRLVGVDCSRLAGQIRLDSVSDTLETLVCTADGWQHRPATESGQLPEEPRIAAKLTHGAKATWGLASGTLAVAPRLVLGQQSRRQREYRWRTLACG